jgi:ribonuclease H2 subunit C
MLAIEKSKRHQGKCTPNILPCRINHNGPVDASKRYWNPTKIGIDSSWLPSYIALMLITFADNKTISYFRGRKLHGKQLKVPKGYRGVVLSSTDRILPKESSSVMVEDDQDTEETPEVKVMEEQSEFDDIMVWGHEALPEDAADPYVRGMEEWIVFAREVCYLSL